MLSGPLPSLSDNHCVFGDVSIIAPEPPSILVVLHLCRVSYVSVSIVPHLCRFHLHCYTSMSPHSLRIFPPIITRFLINPPPSYPYQFTPTLPPLSPSYLYISIFLQPIFVSLSLSSCAPQTKLLGGFYLPLLSLTKFIYAHSDILSKRLLSPLSSISSISRPMSTLRLYPSSRISLSAVHVVPHIHCCNRLPPVYTSDLVCHTHYPTSLRASIAIRPRLSCGPCRIVFHIPASFADVVCLRGSCVSAMSSTASIYIISKYLHHHHPHITRHLLWHFHYYPVISFAVIVAPAFIIILYFIPAALSIVWCCCLNYLLLSPLPFSIGVIHLLMCTVLSYQVFSLLFIIIHYSARSDMLRTTFFTLWLNILAMLCSYLLARLFYISIMFFLHSNLPRFSTLAFTPLCSNLIISLRSVCSGLISPFLICSTMIALLMLWSDCSDLRGSACFYLICLSFLWTF